MKLTPQITRIATASGLFLGAFALAVVAQSTWTAPTAPPPGGNVPAPINVGSTGQEKAGYLWLNSGLRVAGNLLIATSSPSAGKVLTALDNLGTVGWADVSATDEGGTNNNREISGEVTCANNDSGDIYCDIGPTNEWQACFLTAHNPITSSGSWDAGCTILSQSNTWKIHVKATGGDGLTCKARCIGFTGVTTNPIGPSLIVSFTNGTTHSYDTFSSSANSISSAIEEPPTSSPDTNAGGAISNSLSLNTSKTYEVTYTYNPISGTQPNIRFVTGIDGRSTVIGLNIVAQTGTNSVTFTPTQSSGYLEVSVGAGASTNFSMSNIRLTEL